MRNSETRAKLDRAIGYVDTAYNQAIFFGHPHAVLKTEVDAIMMKHRLPTWAREHVRGYARRRTAEIYERHVEYVFVTPNGGFYGAHDDTPYPRADSLYGTKFELCGVPWQQWGTAHAWKVSDCWPARGGKIFNPVCVAAGAEVSFREGNR